MGAEIIPFPQSDGLRLVAENNRRWDAAAEALAQRDYERFDKIMGKREFAPDGPEAA